MGVGTQECPRQRGRGDRGTPTFEEGRERRQRRRGSGGGAEAEVETEMGWPKF
jgi:hypothetical protein